jgi:hypothetical protein
LGLDGISNVDPLLDIVVEYKGNGFIAKVQLLGPAAKPKLILSSTQERPLTKCCPGSCLKKR